MRPRSGSTSGLVRTPAQLDERRPAKASRKAKARDRPPSQISGARGRLRGVIERAVGVLHSWRHIPKCRLSLLKIAASTLRDGAKVHIEQYEKRFEDGELIYLTIASSMRTRRPRTLTKFSARSISSTSRARGRRPPRRGICPRPGSHIGPSASRSSWNLPP
jgi:hypothetical protein